MNVQPELLFESNSPELPSDRLFVGILPDRETAAQIHGIAEDIRQRHGLTSPLRPLHHLHITLRWIDDYLKLPEYEVAQAAAACEAAAQAVAPFEVRLNRVLSWGHMVERKPLVMVGGPGENDPLLECHRVLLRELVKHRCPGRGSRTLNPHLTLLYNQSKVPEETAPPIRWTAGEILLIHSKLGSTEYIERGRWKLGG